MLIAVLYGQMKDESGKLRSVAKGGSVDATVASPLTKGRIEREVGYSTVASRLRKRHLGKHVGLTD